MKYIFGNWKMHLSHQEAFALINDIMQGYVPESTEVAVFPSFTTLHIVKKQIADSRISIGGQDCSAEKKGALTGEVSADMLKESGCKYVIVGHSERRALHNESNELVQKKSLSAINSGIIPVICVGESLSDRENGNFLEIISEQVRKSLPYLSYSSKYIIAYEPVWAIGTGKIPTVDEISQVHKTIASLLYHDTSLPDNLSVKTSIIYGGSVNGSNISELLAADYVDGVLVGGASLNAGEFNKIIKATDK